MRAFKDESGREWKAAVTEESGPDYKGRWGLVLQPADGEGADRPMALDDVRWNSERTAARSLETMSGVELRRRLRSALGRSGLPSDTRDAV